MKYISLILLSICIISPLACDFEESPLTDPTEIYEKAFLLMQEGSFKQAKPLLEQAVSSFSEQKNNDRLTKALTSLVQTNIELGEFRAALNASERAAVLMRKEGDVRGEVKLTLLEGDLYLSMHMYSLAIERYRTAYASATAFDDKIASYDSQLKLASALKTGGDFDEAQEIYKNVLAQAQSGGERQYVAAALGGIGSIYRIQQRYVEAINSLTQGLSSIGRMHDPLLTTQLQEEIGLLHSVQNNPNAALRNFREAINTLRRARIGKDYESVLLFQFGNLFERNGKLIEAKRYYTEAMELARSQGDRIAENYLYIFLVRCNFNLMTPEQRKQNKEKLLQSFDQIAKKFQECRHIAGEGYLYTQIGKEHELRGNLLNARAFYLKSVTLDQSTLAEYYSEELHSPYQKALGIDPAHSDWYEHLSAVLVKLDRQEEALKILELLQIKKLFQTFQSLDISLRHPKVKNQTKDIQVRLWKTKMLEAEYAARLSRRYSVGTLSNKIQLSDNNAMNTLRIELESAKQSLRAESRLVISEFQNYETLVIPGPVDVSSLRKHIPQGALAVEFLPTENELYIFALNRSQLIVRTAPINRDSLFQLMTEYKRLMQDPTVYSGEAGEASVASMTRFATLSTQLYEYLLRPIDDLFEQSIIIVAGNEFDGFPFHTIERQDGRGNVKYVIEFMSVDYITSLSSLRYRTASTARLQEVVAFGNPTGKNWSVDYELRDIRSFFKSAKVMIGLETSWDNLKSVKADILQLSTEFSEPSTELPLGNIVLSNGLMVEQSITIPFEKLSEVDAVPVMILSNHYGQGIGLSAANAHLLRLNGASDIFFNAWLADRKAAKFFSENFFTHIANGLAPGDAYRQALLNLIRTREVSHPRSWGQFFHFGVG